MTGHEWIAEFAAALGVPPPSEKEFEAILELASAAAHGSERLAAPMACWLAAAAGRSPAEAVAAARGVGAS